MADPTVTAIVPATDSPPTLGRCLEALRTASTLPDEVVVVTEPAGTGPAQARNEGARRAGGEVLLFVDADVLVHSDAVARVRAAFAADPALTALFGSYDDAPEAPGAISGFRNLLHHHVHQSAAGPAVTFWAGLGAVRREAFLAAGGFDAERYAVPSIEDVDLGIRLHSGGKRIVLDPGVQGTHLKRWTVASMLHTDLIRRGAPWTELMVEFSAARETLNLGWRHRLSALASLAGIGSVVLRRPRLGLASVLALLTLNRSLYALVWRRRGAWEAATAVPLHVMHHLTAAGAVPAGLAVRAYRRRSRSGPPPRATS